VIVGGLLVFGRGQLAKLVQHARGDMRLGQHALVDQIAAARHLANHHQQILGMDIF